MGWNSLEIIKDCKLTKELTPQNLRTSEPQSLNVYFVHSFYAPINKDTTIAKTNYVLDFSAIIAKGNIYACQFHPEKSSDLGLQIIKNFIHDC